MVVYVLKMPWFFPSNNKGADLPVQPQSLIKSLLFLYEKFYILDLVSVVELAASNPTWSQIWTGFLATMRIYLYNTLIKIKFHNTQR